MDMGKEVYAQKTDFIRLFWEKVVSDVSRWAWHTREQVINRKKPIFLKLAHCIRIFAMVGFSNMYLATDHVGYYEKYGFKFLGMAADPFGGNSRIYGISLK